MQATTVWTELTEIIGSVYQSDNPIQHLALASWAEDRQPPFGTGKKNEFLKEIRKEKRSREIYYIGDTEREIQATI